MSIQYCEHCSKNIDTDFEVEHFEEDYSDYCFKELEKIIMKHTKTLRDVEPGDIIANKHGERKVFFANEYVVMPSCVNKFNTSSNLYTYEELEKFDYKVKQEEPERSIRDVKIGDEIIFNEGSKITYKIIDVGKNGFVDEDEEYFTFYDAEKMGFKIVQ